MQKQDHIKTSIPSLPIYKRFARLWMGVSLFIADILGLSLAIALCLIFLYALEGSWNLKTLEMLQIASISSIAVFSMRGLYPGIGLSPISELRTLSITLSAVILFLAGSSFFMPALSGFSRLALSLFWLTSLVLTPIFRLTARYLISRLPAWGEPVIIFGGGTHAYELHQHLLKRRMLGFDPVLIGLDDETIPLALTANCIYLETLLNDPQTLKRIGIQTAIITTGSVQEPLRTRLLHLQGSVFQRLIKIPEQQDLGSLGVSPLDLDGMFALEIRQNLGSARQRLIKRLIDLTLTIVGGLLILPFLLLIGWIVRRSSPGPIIYRQTRIGKAGRPFQAWKFRTMRDNAEEELEKTLRENPGMRAEWEESQKLKNDPRITQVGRFLRKFSLDELPQLWNVLRGEMSLVGPRPCMEDQVSFYGDNFDLYTAVLPGITGLWQVSGRNTTTYAERVRLDAYYVRNWSIWMDIYILFKTFWVVLKHDGAY